MGRCHFCVTSWVLRVFLFWSTLGVGIYRHDGRVRRFLHVRGGQLLQGLPHFGKSVGGATKFRVLRYGCSGTCFGQGVRPIQSAHDCSPGIGESKVDVTSWVRALLWLVESAVVSMFWVGRQGGWSTNAIR